MRTIGKKIQEKFENFQGCFVGVAFLKFLLPLGPMLTKMKQLEGSKKTIKMCFYFQKENTQK